MVDVTYHSVLEECGELVADPEAVGLALPAVRDVVDLSEHVPHEQLGAPHLVL